MFSVDNIGSCNPDLKPYDLIFERVTDKNRKGENEARFLNFIFWYLLLLVLQRKQK